MVTKKNQPCHYTQGNEKSFAGENGSLKEADECTMELLPSYGEPKKRGGELAPLQLSRRKTVAALGLTIFCNVALLIFSIRNIQNAPHPTPEERGWVRPPVVYGLVHIAKTAGTEINGNLTMHYERVCGNKGNSYDAFQVNEARKARPPEERDEDHHANDAVHKLYGVNLDRGHPPVSWLWETGFEDCDYVALESKFLAWKKLQDTIQSPLELHVPCRDPLEHLMSSCNYHSVTFDCNGDLDEEINKCDTRTNKRFSWKLKELTGTLKCFSPFPPYKYVNYMGKFLQRKRMETDFVHWSTNQKRNRTNECIWSQPKEFQDMLKQRLKQTYQYYVFCDDCMGSSDELPLDS